MKRLKYETTTAFSFSLAATLSALSIVMDDITEAVFLVKIDPADTDDLALVNKTLSAGVAKGSTTLDVTLALSDYGSGKIESNEIYFIGLGIKTSSITEFYEVPVLSEDDADLPFKDSRILFEADVIRSGL